MSITTAATEFIESTEFEHLPAEAIRIARRCLLDGAALIVAGSTEDAVRILAEEAGAVGGRDDALLLGGTGIKVPATAAARVLGAAGHALDWDDTQVTNDPEHSFGMLMHPTIPPFAAALTVSQMTECVGGQRFLLAFLVGFEVECKISEWMRPDHYLKGMHTSGTVGTFGAFAAAAKLMNLTGDQLRHGLGIAASMAAGIRCNYGTMTKPLHVGRAAENGIAAALLADRGFTADKGALDGIWGFFSVHGNGFSPGKTEQGFGEQWSIISPGVAIKPYPCGVLTHPVIDLMRKIVVNNDLSARKIHRITVHAGSNILDPIRYQTADDHLQAKFCLPAQLAMIVLRRQAGRREFSDEFIASPDMQSMQGRIVMRLDPEIEARSFDKLRARIVVECVDGKRLEDCTDEAYRGGPDNPLTDVELEDKVKDCCDGIISKRIRDQLIKMVWNITEVRDVSILAELLQHSRRT